MNHWTVQRERGRIECVVTAGSLSESTEGIRAAASAFVLTVKGRKESRQKVEKDMNWYNVIKFLPPVTRLKNSLVDVFPYKAWKEGELAAVISCNPI